MLHLTLTNLRSHLRRLVSTSLAVVLGVGFLAATLFIGDTMRAGFDSSFTEANEGLAVVVRSDERLGSDETASLTGTIDLSLRDAVEGVEGVDAVAPRIEGRGQIVGADGTPLGGDGPPTIAGNWVDVDSLNPYEIAEGRPPAAPGEVVIDRGSSERGDLAVGDRTTVLTPTPVEVTVVGIATFGEADSLGPSTWVAFSTEQAQELFVGDASQVHELLVAAGGTDPDALAEEVAAIAGPGTEVLTGTEVTAEQLAAVESDFIGFFETMLLVFAGIALLVATFSIHNTFSILVAQRTRESALLRALGASRRQVLGAVSVEALLVGVVASIAGLAAGVGLARLALLAMDAAGFSITSSLTLEPGAALIAAGLGVAVTLVASIAPALAASRVAPLAALRDVAVERTRTSTARVAAGALLLVAAGAGLATATAAGDGAMGQAALAGAGVLVGGVLLGPVIARPVASALGAPFAAVRGTSGVLARRNAVRNPRRTSGTASALTLGVAVVALFTVFAASVTTAIDDTVERSFGGDLVVATRDFSGAGLSAELAPAIEDLPEVETAVGIGEAVARIDGSTVYPTVSDPVRLERLLDLDVREGDLAGVGIDGMAVGVDVAEEEGWAVGDRVELDLGGHTEVLTVDAIFGTTDLIGDLVVHPDMWAAHAPQRSDVAVLVGVTDGVSPAEADAAVSAVTERFSAPAPQDRDEYVDTVAGEINSVLGMIYGLLAIAVLIALMGIANTVSLSIHERTRELGLLRAVGQTRAQMRSMVRAESVIVAVFGTVSGIVLGIVLGWGLLRAVSEAEGLAAPLTIPVTSLLVVVGIGALAGVAAGWRPARRAARMDVLAAIATD